MQSGRMRQDPIHNGEELSPGWPALTRMERMFSADAAARLCQKTSDHLTRLSELLHSLDEADETAIVSVGERSQLLRILAERRLRMTVFGEPLPEPAWVILLTLYLAELDQRRTNVTSVADLAGVPAATTIRQIEMLVHRGLVSRQPHAVDQRVIWVALTEAGVAGVRTCLGKLSEEGRPRSKS